MRVQGLACVHCVQLTYTCIHIHADPHNPFLHADTHTSMHVHANPQLCISVYTHTGQQVYRLLAHMCANAHSFFRAQSKHTSGTCTHIHMFTGTRTCMHSHSMLTHTAHLTHVSHEPTHVCQIGCYEAPHTERQERGAVGGQRRWSRCALQAGICTDSCEQGSARLRSPASQVL